MIPVCLRTDELRKADGTGPTAVDVLHAAFDGEALREIIRRSNRSELRLAHDGSVVTRRQRVHAGNAGRCRVRQRYPEFFSPAAEQS